ncbi:hypothetical protein [Ottowia caeni]|uniref:hypothetical protein n=1 Tax=Ottowia caeni TaxID=2870339 RepID=UPI003D74D555
MWLGIGLIGGLVSVAVVWSYLHALGADQNVEHARAMAMAVLLVTSAGVTAGLTRLRRAASGWVVFGTLASMLLMIQIPVVSRFLNLHPLHVQDWLLVAAAFWVVVLCTLVLSSRSRE